MAVTGPTIVVILSFCVLYLGFQLILYHKSSLLYVWEEVDFFHRLDPHFEDNEEFTERWRFSSSKEERAKQKSHDRQQQQMELLDGNSNFLIFLSLLHCVVSIVVSVLDLLLR